MKLNGKEKNVMKLAWEIASYLALEAKKAGQEETAWFFMRSGVTLKAAHKK